MSIDVPRSVREETERPDPDSTFCGAQKNAILQAIRFARTVGLEGDYSRLADRVKNDRVLRQHDRHELSAVLTVWIRQQEPGTDALQHASWAKSDVWDANRLRGDER